MKDSGPVIQRTFIELLIDEGLLIPDPLHCG